MRRDGTVGWVPPPWRTCGHRLACPEPAVAIPAPGHRWGRRHARGWGGGAGLGWAGGGAAAGKVRRSVLWPQGMTWAGSCAGARGYSGEDLFSVLLSVDEAEPARTAGPSCWTLTSLLAGEDSEADAEPPRYQRARVRVWCPVGSRLSSSRPLPSVALSAVPRRMGSGEQGHGCWARRKRGAPGGRQGPRESHPAQIVQMSNYCGIGIDAELSLDFHQARRRSSGVHEAGQGARAARCCPELPGGSPAVTRGGGPS